MPIMLSKCNIDKNRDRQRERNRDEEQAQEKGNINNGSGFLLLLIFFWVSRGQRACFIIVVIMIIIIVYTRGKVYYVYKRRGLVERVPSAAGSAFERPVEIGPPPLHGSLVSGASYERLERPAPRYSSQSDIVRR